MQLSIIASSYLTYSSHIYPDIQKTDLWTDYDTTIAEEFAKGQAIYVVYDCYEKDTLRLSLCKRSETPTANADFDLLTRHYRIFSVAESVLNTWHEILTLEHSNVLARAYKFDVVNYNKDGARQIEISI
ncbi:hypothetical protein [Vagococcus intermedius]|uniref:Uncharacterized protein n=1 Tax=Vagococcus intermedius TaxID=2991418 RepID=A0AAF0CTD4_9ENTE|nr:hypothetical protein [Vagococcus intermedius]WEG72546.1 hypothetical protein OL234_06035 [Vagococcus intermedius]WEG74632.1 hypothetical protein OL235_06035 [Vagococcus intermedius]